MGENKKKIAIVWANPYSKNLGVGALAYSALALLNDVAQENNVDAKFTFFGSFINESDSITINGKLIHFQNIRTHDLLNWKSIVKMMFFKSKLDRSKIFGFDYVFDIAEGDSFTDIYGSERFNLILSSKIFFSFLGKKQTLLPQTIGPFKDPAHEKRAFEAMQKMDMVISRDKQSYDYTARFLAKDKIAETIDVAFYMPFERSGFSKGKVNVGINVSGLLWSGGYTQNNQFGMKTDYKKLIRDTVQYFSDQGNVQIHLVPHVIPLDFPVEDDCVASEEIKKEFPDVIIAPRFQTPIDAKSYISGLDFFTGARMHACIAAFSSGVPVYPMAYSRKFNGLFKDTLQYSWMGDCVNESETQVFDGIKGAYENRKNLAELIAMINNSIVKDRLTLLKGVIAKILKR